VQVTKAKANATTSRTGEGATPQDNKPAPLCTGEGMGYVKTVIIVFQKK
jgi:hypothetical protein